jgi:hypothetical protein
MENLMTKPTLLSAAMMAAALLLTTPGMARQGQLTSQRLIASARITTTAHGADGQIRFRNRASDLRGLAERDVWGHWGAYYGPMVGAH